MSDALPILLLQRRRTDGDAGRWRTVLSMPLAQGGRPVTIGQRMDEATRLVRMADRIDASLRWRLTIDAAFGDAYYWEAGRWIRAAS